MSRRPLTGRADLLLALAGGDAVMADIAARLGYIHNVVFPEPQQVDGAESRESTEIVTNEVTHGTRPAVPWWRAQEFCSRQIVPLPPAEDDQPAAEVTLEPFDPLATVPAFVTRLRQVAELARPGNRIDLKRVVDELSRGRQIAVFPRLNRRSWGQDLHVVIDYARRLLPYRQDQMLIREAMQRLLPKGGGTVCVLREGDETPVIVWPEQHRGQELPLHPGSTWLVLSDLGAMQDGNSTAPEERWVRIGRRLNGQECSALALVPCRPDAVPDRLARLWTLIPWEGESRLPPTPAHATTVAACERILALLSAAVKIEPRLLRAVRKLLVAGRRDPGLESKVWQQCEGTTHCSGAALSQKQAIEFRGALLQDDLRQRAWSLIEAAHRGEYAGVAVLEVLRLGKDIAKLGDRKRLAQARRWFQSLGTGETTYGGEFFVKAASQLTPEAWEAAPELHVLWKQFFPDDDAAPGYDPALAGVNDAPLQVIRVSQAGGQFEYRRRGAMPERCSPLATIRLKNPEIVVDSFDKWPDEDSDDAFWLAAAAPTWADRWGRDDVGPWVEFVIGETRQRMRWIPPGEFLMGSPKKPEVERYAETPQQPVTISRGFWLFDTPCTQELWQAVMGENPSRFKGAQRPVETVSWEDCQKFHRRLGELCPGLALTLPTEAEWEYACRAGSEAATYAGDGSLGEIAWFSGNAGGETHPVGELRPNRLGLHDMLGNVWEWCRDHAGRKYDREQVTDPLHETGVSSAFRVFRGGSWGNSARYVRAACRFGDHPGFRDFSLGFRCSSSGSEPGTGVRRAGEEAGGRRPQVVRSQRAVRGWSRRGAGGDSEPASEDRLVRVTGRDSDFAPVPQGPIVRLRTDLEEVFLCQAPRPRWASRMGRDQFGLWAEFTVPRRDADNVSQRLRWIPPGRFLMGSPKSEKGRFDDEGPQHEAMVAAGFWLFDTPCTQGLWNAVMGNNPSQFKGDRRPVEQVSWHQAADFVSKLSVVAGLQLQLPTETQWEYACRAGSDAATYAGDFDPGDPATQQELQRIAWYGQNAGGKTHDVGELRPNPWGLYDMLGNVLEWCRDTWSDRYDKAREEDSSSAIRVIRGGSWGSSAQSVRAAYRDGIHPGYRADDLGVRCSSSGGEPG
jgi:formylglycine-generating enzyme required for sulfatase activity